MQATIDLLSVLEHRRKNALLIDVRTPAEFAEATIPGALNIPLFSNAERAEIGTLYKQQGKIVARRRGVILAAPRIPDLVAQVDAARRTQSGPIVFFCWRGGMRSLAMTTFMNLAGIPARQLSGGHKAFRRLVCDHFEQQSLPPIYVLRGLTGVGKTRILQQLQQRDFPVVDLEALANHRGSAFGALGLKPQPSQKMFEALLWERLDQLRNSPYLITEGESRHIGRLTIPVRFHQAMQQQPSLWLHAGMELRTSVILNDYTTLSELHEPISRALDALRERLGNSTVAELQELRRNEDWKRLIAELMQRYYDPLYLHTKPPRQLTICYDSLEEGVARTIAAVDGLIRHQSVPNL